jgi:hypothetical protein
MMPLSRLLHPTHKALRDLALRGYLIHDGQVWWIADDDTDKGLEEVLIGPAGTNPEDTYWMLAMQGWPTTGSVLCQMCHDAESDLGGFCGACQKIVNEEARGEAERELAMDREMDREWGRP